MWEVGQLSSLPRDQAQQKLPHSHPTQTGVSDMRWLVNTNESSRGSQRLPRPIALSGPMAEADAAHLSSPGNALNSVTR